MQPWLSLNHPLTRRSVSVGDVVRRPSDTQLGTFHLIVDNPPSHVDNPTSFSLVTSEGPFGFAHQWYWDRRRDLWVQQEVVDTPFNVLRCRLDIISGHAHLGRWSVALDC